MASSAAVIGISAHGAVPVRTSLRYNVPGAVLTMALWIFGSYLLRWILTVTAGESTSIYGPLAAPIVVMLWLYLLSIAILIGAALDAAFDRLWPEKETARARMEVVRKLRLRTMMSRQRRDQAEQERFPVAAADTVALTLYDEERVADAAGSSDSSDPADEPTRPARRAGTPRNL